MASDISARFKAFEVAQGGLLVAFSDHERQDERRFAELTTRFETTHAALTVRFEKGQTEIRSDLVALLKTVNEAIAGDAKTEGIRERVRTIEAQHATRESDMRWMKRMVWTTLAGLVASVLAGAVLFLFTKGGGHL